MRIEEFYVKRYGPLRDRSYTLSHSFNLFFGKNEDGKTLTIDALVRLLLGKKVRDFKGIDRVGENPEGYVILKDDQGMDVKLPQKGMLPKLTGLTPSECRNIFVIRNSDLSISDESGFYMSVTDRLIGLRANEICKIKETLREIGKMTPGGFFRDTKEEKLKTRIEDAENLISRITSLAGEIEEEGYDELEEESANCRDELDSVTQLMEHLEDARKREKYEKGREALGKLKNSLEKLGDLGIYNSESAQIWRDSRRDILRLEEVKKGLERDVEKEEAELRILTKEVIEKERDFQFFEEAESVLDNEVRQELSDYGRKLEEFTVRKGKRRFLDSTVVVSTVLFGISLLGIIFRPVSTLYIFGAVLLGLCFLLWILKFQIVRHEASLAGAFQRMRLTLSGFELDAESIERILSNIQGFDEDYRKRKDELQTISRKKESIEGKIRELRQKTIPDLDIKIKNAENRITELKMSSREGSLEGYQGKLHLRQELEKLADEQKSVLRSHFGQIHEEGDQNLLQWEKEVESLEQYKDKAKDREYSEEAMTRLVKEKRKFDERLREIESKTDSFQRKMVEVERKVNEILRPEEYYHCRTSIDLGALKNRLRTFLNENEGNKNTVSDVIRIFEEIEMEEKEKVSELFDTESPVSKYFSEITGGLYREVRLDQGLGEIQVEREDGLVLDAGKLSGGAYDQLYLSIRLALGERLLKGKKGFFIMDDPFIKADIERLERQIEVLKRISESGWQVVYFSAKEEIRDALRKDIERGLVNRTEIQSI